LRAHAGWRPVVLQARARDGEGVDELVAALDANTAWLDQSGERAAKLRRAMESRVRDLVQDRLVRDTFETPETKALFAAGLEAIVSGASTPYRLAETILDANRRTIAASQSGSKG
jgi:LAO/AO transport system kinase